MSNPTQKRALPSKVAKMQARKRQKLDPAEEAPLSQKASVPRKRAAAADELTWKKAAFPEGMGDFEGLYGDFFEELSDTEIVKEGGKVIFQVKEDCREDAPKKRKADGKGHVVSGELESGIDFEEEDEWTGIDDENESKQPSIKSESQPGSKPPKKTGKMTKKEQAAKLKAEKWAARKAEKKAAAAKGKTVTTQKAGLPQTPFSILEAMDGDNEEDGVDISAWNKLNLSDPVAAALSKLKFAKPTRIQAAAIPHILEGNDLIGKAPTGSGKTLAFGIPIYDHWLSQYGDAENKPETKKPTALIILPTRELAHQIAEHLTKLCSQPHIPSPVIATLTGGLSIQKQQRVLAHADFVIATPGRLWEVIGEGEGTLSSLKEIKFLVIDEADRLLSEGHFKELEEVLTALDRKVTHEEHTAPTNPAASTNPTIARQTLIFSATFSKTLQQKLAKRAYSSRSSDGLLSNQASMEYLLQKLNFRDEKPLFIDVNPISQMAANLREGLVECASATDKDLYLYTLLLYHPNTRALVFVNSISAVRRLVPFLTNLNLTAHALHSQMPQKARLRSIERFSATSAPTSNGSTILVATDVAARGLDIPDVSLILHYHLPRAADTYVHRSGRTARADNPGTSILVCAPQEAAGVRRLVAQVHARDAVAQKTPNAVGKKEAHYFMRTLDVDARVVAALKPRVVLAKKLADAGMAKEKQGRADEWYKAAAEELGVDMDEEEFEALTESQGGGKAGGKGKGRKEKEKVAGGLSKAEMGALRAELKGLLARRVNVGVSERYLTGGAVDVEGLLKQQRDGVLGGEFLGRVPSLGFDDE